MRRILAAALVGLVGFAGCGGEEEDKIPLVPVTGKVTINGKPMANATVTFAPESSNKHSTPGSDTTGPEGNYKITYKQRSGLAVGKYKVTVTEGLQADSKANEAFANDPLMAKLATPPKKEGDKKLAGTKNEFDADVTEKGGEFDFDVKAGAAKK